MPIIAPMFKSVVQIVVFATVAIATVIGLFIAWWIAVCLVLCFAAYVATLRFLAGKRGAPTGPERSGKNAPVIIEGQFNEVEEEPGAERGPRRSIDSSRYKP